MSAAERSRSAMRRKLTHLDAKQRPGMVSVADKAVTQRVAVAEARVNLPLALARELKRLGARTHKGPVFDTAIIAGVMAAKRTADIIPLCHPLPLERCDIDISWRARGVVVVRCRVEVRHKTGVEMEALTGAMVAALTLYDMCKAWSHEITIGAVRLVSKSGGRREVRAGRMVRT
jgi:cyclic pyranopterin phosphate synthase